MKTKSTITFHATEDVIAWWLQIDNSEPGRLINKLIQDHYIKPNSIATSPTHTEEQVKSKHDKWPPPPDPEDVIGPPEENKCE